MALEELRIRPGVFTDATPRDAGKAGYWAASEKVRFVEGMPTKLGGWTRGAGDATFAGAARGVCDWRTYRSEVLIAFGTHLKLYVWSGGTYYDITPIRATGNLTNPFTTTNTSAVVTVADTAHGLAVGDYVHYTGATAVGGITISGEYTVTALSGADAYTITHSAAATSSAGPGGGTVTYSYEIGIGSADSVAGLGWGAGNFGAETWGTPRSVSDFLTFARNWTIEQWGEDIICAPRQGGIYVWDSSAGVGTRATLISQAPTTTKSILVSPEDRHLIALGAYDGVADNPMYVRWCSTEDYTDWTATTTNTAGAKQLDMGNEILTGAKVRGEHLIFTDSSLYAMAFVGPPDTFGFRTLGDNGGLAGPQAVHVFEGAAYWMGQKDFFKYDGVTSVIPCTIQSVVFKNINRDQLAKVWCGINREFREVWWLYPSENSSECDSYALYNLQDQLWSYGTLDRTMIIGDSDVIQDAFGFGVDGYMYTHEVGTDDYDQPMTAYIQSGDVEISATGEQLAHVGKLIPDLKDAAGTVQVTLTGKKYPQASETQTSGPHTVTPTTEFINPRMRGRQISIRWESTALGDEWQIGTPRIDLIPHGGR